MSGLCTEDRDELKKGELAFPEQRKEPLENASHVRNAISRFKHVKDVTNNERDAAWKRIKAAARKFDVEVSEADWREIGARQRGLKNDRRPDANRAPTGVRRCRSVKSPLAAQSIHRPRHWHRAFRLPT